MGCFSSKPRRYISEEGEAVVETKHEYQTRVKKNAQTAMKKMGEELVNIVDDSYGDYWSSMDLWFKLVTTKHTFQLHLLWSFVGIVQFFFFSSAYHNVEGIVM